MRVLVLLHRKGKHLPAQSMPTLQLPLWLQHRAPEKAWVSMQAFLAGSRLHLHPCTRSRRPFQIGSSPITAAGARFVAGQLGSLQQQLSSRFGDIVCSAFVLLHWSPASPMQKRQDRRATGFWPAPGLLLPG